MQVQTLLDIEFQNFTLIELNLKDLIIAHTASKELFRDSSGSSLGLQNKPDTKK